MESCERESSFQHYKRRAERAVEEEDLRTGQVTHTVSYVILSVPSQAFGLVCEVQETFLFIDNRLVITAKSGHLWSTM